MNKRDLWDKFIQTGKISDYLDYQRAENREEDDESPDFEASEEFFVECPNGEDYEYDDEDGRYSNP